LLFRIGDGADAWNHECSGEKSLNETQQMMMAEAQQVHDLLADLFDAVMEGFMKKYFPSAQIP